MRTDLSPLRNKTNRLSLHDITLLDLSDVDAWLFAIDLTPSERKDACWQIMYEGGFHICNIEYRIEVDCNT